MTQKSPYEIRSELVQTAADHLQKQFHENVTFAYAFAQKAIEAVKLPASSNAEQITEYQKQLFEQMFKLMPKAPTTEEILKRAQEFYGFVSKKD